MGIRDRIRTLFGRKPPPPETIRKVALNNAEFNAKCKYFSTNKIITSKYTALTFVPLNLFEQFHRFANLYFLILIILQFIPQISSLNPVTSLLPLIFVLAVTAVKDGVDDWRRHKSDKKVNKRKVTVIRQTKELNETWENVVVGDIVRLKKDEAVTADMVVLLTSEPTGFCLIETAELDGETNLKVRQATGILSRAFQDQVEYLKHYKCEVHCEPPNNNLSKFEGVLYHGPRSTVGADPDQFGKTPLTNDNLLLRGCTLRATEWVYGLVIFTGRDTKLMRNAGAKRYKTTSVDTFLNRAVIGIFISMLVCCFVCTLYHLSWERHTGVHFQIYQPWEAFMPKKNIAGMFILRAIMIFLSYFILFNTFVPVSLYVSVEIVRLAQSLLITWDKDMWYEETDTPADVRNTSLSEELGQIQYVFSDKTGTLTQNVMTLNKCSIYGVKYGDVLDETVGEDIDPYEEGANVAPIDLVQEMTPDADPKFLFYDTRLIDAIRYQADTRTPAHNDIMLRHYFRLMALCNTVVPSRVPVPGGDSNATVLSYQAQSPDENALISAARSFGYVLHKRDVDSLTIVEPGPGRTFRTLKFPLLHLLDFDNVRKRMSVIVRDPDDENSIIIYCKGADSSLFPVAYPHQEAMIDRTTEHLQDFASKGLRTLVFGMRILSMEQYTDWKRRCDVASAAVGDRDDKVRTVYNEIEKDFTIIGASAIEDKLQDGVPLAIKQLLQAGIRMWVLTGDKQETAINIGYSCNLLTTDTKLTVITDEHASTPGRVASMLSQLYYEIEGKLYKPPVRLDEVRRNMTVMQRVRSTLPDPNVIFGRISAIFSRDTLVSVGLIDNPRLHQSSQASAQDGTPPVFALSITGSALDSILPHLNKSKKSTINSTSTVSSSSSQVFSDSEDDGPQTVSAKNMMDLFIKVAGRCTTVVCCRMTPLAKARVVELFRRHLHARTCSIGDGANDVPMIRSANIGVGIAGREGLQAVLASDFAIAQFRFLAKLLLVHGRWSYPRMAKFILYFLYKNLTFTLGHFFFAFYCGGTAQTAYDPIFVGLFNTLYTAVPCVVLGGSDQDITPKGLMAFPQLYDVGLTGKMLNFKLLLLTFIDSIYSAACVFFVHYGATSYMNKSAATGVEFADLRTFSFTLGFTSLSLVTLRCAMATNYWTFWNHLSIWGSLVVYWLVAFGFGPLIYGLFDRNYEYEGAQYAALKWAPTWIASLGAITLAVLPGVFITTAVRCLKPTLTDAVREVEDSKRDLFFVKVYKFFAKMASKAVPTPQPQETPAAAHPVLEMHMSTASQRSTGSLKLRRSRPMGDSFRNSGTGFGYSHTEGFGDLLTGHQRGSIPPIYSTHM